MTTLLTVYSAIDEFSAEQITSPVWVYDTAAVVQSELDVLQLMAAAGDIGRITLADYLTPTLTVSSEQLSQDAQVLALINTVSSAPFNLTVEASDSDKTIAGPTGHFTIVSFSGASTDYAVTSSSAGSFTVTGLDAAHQGSVQLSDVSFVQFADGVETFSAPGGATGSLLSLGGALKLFPNSLYESWTPNAVSAQGQIVGTWGGIGEQEPVVWSGGAVTPAPTPSGSSGGDIFSINASGQAVGDVDTGYAGERISMAALWSSITTQPISLGELPGDTGGSEATAINDKGQVVGISFSSLTDLSAPIHGFIWQNGVMTNLGALASIPNGSVQPAAINDAGQVVGTISYSTPFLWQNGQMTALPMLAGGGGAAVAINASGEIVGYSAAAGNVEHAVFWKNGQITDIGLQMSFARAVNDAGLIVGSVGSGAAVWADGTVILLNDLMPADSGWGFTDATAINDAGQVIGTAYYNGNPVSFELTLPSVLTVSAAEAALNFKNGEVYGLVTVGDTAAGIGASLDGLQTMAAAGELASVILSDAGTPAIPVSIAQMTSDAGALGTISGKYTLAVQDSAANISGDLDGLQALVAAGKVSAIAVTDTDFPALAVTAAQMTSDAGVLKDLSGGFVLAVAASAQTSSVTGLSGHANLVSFTGAAAQYDVTVSAGGSIVTVAGNGGSTALSGITALHFSDGTDLLAAQPGTGSAGQVTTGNIAELYGAVFGRVPDVAGLAYYQGVLAANPSLPLTDFAQWFLASPEYTGNVAHNYAQTVDGETQFITDSYANLLHRAPETGAVPYYLSVIAQFTNGLTAGTSAYAAADALAHAYVLTYFSNSPEFLTDVQVTAKSPSDAQHWLILT